MGGLSDWVFKWRSHLRVTVGINIVVGTNVPVGPDLKKKRRCCSGRTAKFSSVDVCPILMHFYSHCRQIRSMGKRWQNTEQLTSSKLLLLGSQINKQNDCLVHYHYQCSAPFFLTHIYFVFCKYTENPMRSLRLKSTGVPFSKTPHCWFKMLFLAVGTLTYQKKEKKQIILLLTQIPRS